MTKLNQGSKQTLLNVHSAVLQVNQAGETDRNTSVTTLQGGLGSEGVFFRQGYIPAHTAPASRPAIASI